MQASDALGHALVVPLPLAPASPSQAPGVTVVIVVVASLVLAAGCDDPTHCDAIAPAVLRALPDTLSATGIAGDGVQPFTPAFSLWSDGASKKRFIALPAGTAIDTSDMNNWRFPVGTRLWKEFTRDGVRVETRLIEKLGDRDDVDGNDRWAAQAYLWRDDDSDADALPEGAQNVRGTEHDVPAAAQCTACHAGRKSFALGFSALQLGDVPAEGRADGDLDLDALVSRQLVSRVPSHPIRIPGDDVDRKALGFLHANCSHCHNQDRPVHSGARCFDPQNEPDMFVLADVTRVASLPTVKTMVGDKITAGDPDGSDAFVLASRRGIGQMPPLATEKVDADDIAALRAWIQRLR